MAVLNLGVQVLADTVQEALEQANASLNAMLNVLDDHGIEEQDTQTRFLNIQPRYRSREVIRCKDDIQLPVPTPGELEPEILEKLEGECLRHRELVLIGYQVTNQLSVKVRDLDSVGPIIDDVVQAGGDPVRIQGINFTLEGTSSLIIQAREEAVLDALAKAEQFAGLTGVEVGPLVHISEAGGAIPVVRAAFEGALPAQAGAPSPVRTGELEVTVTVQALFSIQ